MKGIKDMRPIRPGELELKFALEFVPPIRDYKTKIHTIRRDTQDNFREGVKFYCTAGESGLVFEEKTVTATQSITIDIDDSQNVKVVRILIDCREIQYDEMKQLAYNDGFKTFGDFVDFFYKKCENMTYRGKIIHWTNKKY